MKNENNKKETNVAVLSYDYYEITNEMVSWKEYGYCAEGSVTDNPDDTYRIITIENAADFHRKRVDAMDEVLEEAKQYTEDCSEKRIIERIEELKKFCTIRNLEDIATAPDGKYISIRSIDLSEIMDIEDLPFPEVFKEKDNEKDKSIGYTGGYIGTITETLEKSVYIPNATSLEDANRKLRQAYKDEEIVLTADDFDCSSVESVCRELSESEMQMLEDLPRIN